MALGLEAMKIIHLQVCWKPSQLVQTPWIIHFPSNSKLCAGVAIYRLARAKPPAALSKSIH